jgi:hypothetical protein
MGRLESAITGIESLSVHGMDYESQICTVMCGTFFVYFSPAGSRECLYVSNRRRSSSQDLS